MSTEEATVNNSSNEDNSNNKSNEDNSNDICVVCFKNVVIYSIGECDHPVCYECSTRMRVLCQQNECPICRKSLSKVIFTNQKCKYRELEANNRSEYYNKKYKISFENAKIQEAFNALLEHPCPICDLEPFHNFKALSDHVRRQHEHYYCDICSQHLKIFTIERKCYNRVTLATHRRKGDADNKSHRGHPLCEYCDTRFLDRDELFRHLRVEHYFCHFCDADGSNEFYENYDALREHFRTDHYLCEEGDCIREQFTAVFRSDIDLKAHFASVHGKNLSKQQAKHARTLQLEISLGHRGRSQQNNGANLSIRRMDEIENDQNQERQQQQPKPTSIAPMNEQEFPSLAGVSTNATNATVINMANIRRTGPGGLARTKENFPALGRSINEGPKSSSNNKTPATSAVLKGNVRSVQNSNLARPGSSKVKGINKNDFPALPGKSKQSTQHKYDDDDDIDYNSELNHLNPHISAKHRNLVDDYVSIVNPSTTSKIQKIQAVQENNVKSKKNNENSEIKLGKGDFPALPTATRSTPSTSQQVSWGLKIQKQKELENKKSKVAPAPVLPKKNENIKKDDINEFPAIGNGINNTKKKNNKNTEPKKSNNEQNILKNQKNLEQNKKTELTKKEKKNNTETAKVVNGYSSNDAPSNRNRILKPPPGFNSVILKGVEKPINITSSSSQLDQIDFSNAIYTPPPNAEARNKELPFHFQNALETPEAFSEFRIMSSQFRQGNFDAAMYFQKCREALKNKFDDIFPELLALLPDVKKQQELFVEYQKYVKTKSKNLRPHQKVEMCYICKQILKSLDLDSHVNSHLVSSNFPKL